MPTSRRATELSPRESAWGPTRTEALASTIGRGPAGQMTHLFGQSSGSRRQLSPSLPLGHPICPRHPTCPKGAKGPGNDAQPVCWSTGDPLARRERVRHCVCIGAKREATILVTVGGQGPARSDCSQVVYEFYGDRAADHPSVERIWRGPGTVRASVRSGGIRNGCANLCGCTTATRFAG
jgi:hypothetical protein